MVDKTAMLVFLAAILVFLKDELVRHLCLCLCVFVFQVCSYQHNSSEALEDLLNFVLLACGATATDGPYRPPEVLTVDLH